MTVKPSSTPTSVIHEEVDWERKYRESGYAGVSTLRRDPRKNSTTTMHLASAYGALDRHTGRPVAGQQSFYMGPAQRVVGGELRWIQPDAPARPKVTKTQDTNELLRQYTAMLSAHPGGLEDLHQQTSQQDQRAISAETQGDKAMDPFERAALWSQARRAQTAPTGTTRRDYRQAPSNTRPLVYWDGKSQRVIEPAPGHEGPVGLQEEQLGWSRTEAELQKTVHTSNGTGGLMGRSTGLMTTARNPLGTTSKQQFGLTPAALAQYSLADSIRTYGMVFKPIGHKDYEAIAHNMEGLNSWENTQSDLSSSVALGKPSRLMGPWEHTTSKLSLRRPTSTGHTTRRF